MFEKFKESMMVEFDMSDLGLMHYFLSIEVKQSTTGIFISQKKYAQEILERFQMKNCNFVSTPMEMGLKLVKEPDGRKVDSTLDKQIVGSLMYLTTTRPAILHAVSLINRYMEHPKEIHLLAAKRILWLQFSGLIPDTMGSLNQLLSLSLGANNFTGEIPPSFGNLSKLFWLDITDNNISGEIPVSNETLSSLDLLVNIQHFHFGQNKLEGTIPPQLFSSKMNLRHALFDDNLLTGSIPSTITLMRCLEVIKLDRNSLSGVVNLSGLLNLTELVLSNNKLNGNLDIGANYSRKLKLIDLQKNFITQFTEGYEYNGTLKTGFSLITSELNNVGFYPSLYPFGSFHFILDNNEYFTVHNKSSNIGIIIGASAVGFATLLLLLVALVYAFNQRRKVERASQLRDPFASWDNNGKSGSGPQITGLRCFSFEEIKKSTNNFSDANIIGTGGYGKGSVEFKTEIEFLSKIYHKNLFSLLGFCYEVGEQMLVYEYVSNGSLKDCISGKSGIRLSWERRLKIALDSARGLAYLHDHVNPPIIHRDAKSSNILLDDQLNGKVADFDLSKLLGHSSHVSDNVKGTMQHTKRFRKFVDLAIMCVEELRVNRPTMTEVVEEIENILKQASLHSDAEMVSNSNSQDVSSRSSFYSPLINKDQEHCSGSFPYSEIELK
ncbi:hypothetical protein GH714_006271 [Hevea brasiliensis]|uniref:Protein kinase domain-containing protein n=1 Tax=Hevea brasiliensis TaxID=3981 RepID=A0A6A6MDK1_HEVBR|nr:hypothetical protein GH714_006222 [Hevea brasiliensis]KAF2310039.1 hypothetical protein GH714_006271 [Hevea brasiliensis]